MFTWRLRRIYSFSRLQQSFNFLSLLTSNNSIQLTQLTYFKIRQFFFKFVNPPKFSLLLIPVNEFDVHVENKIQYVSYGYQTIEHQLEFHSEWQKIFYQKKKILIYKTFSIISIHDIVIPALLVNKYATLDDKNNKLNNFTSPWHNTAYGIVPSRFK